MRGSFPCWRRGEFVSSALRSPRPIQLAPIRLMAPQRALNMIDHCIIAYGTSARESERTSWTGKLGRFTFLCWEDSDHVAELTFPVAVVDAHFHFKLGQRCNVVIFVNIPGRIRWRHNCLDPSAAANRAERHDVAEVLAALVFLRNWLSAQNHSADLKQQKSIF